MAFANWTAMVDADLAGNTFLSSWRKSPSQATAQGVWFDLSMSPGNPVPNYYAATPNIAIALAQSTDGGIPHGGAVSPSTKYLKRLTCLATAATALPLGLVLCDYLMFYPFTDMSITDPQPLTTNIPLPRYPTGAGVQIMAVEVAAQSGMGLPRFQVQYTNQAGVTGRLTQVVSCNQQVTNGTIINTSQVGARSNGPFLPLQQGDTGVRAIESVQYFDPDFGLVALVLVKPIEDTSIRGIDAAVERVPVLDFVDLPVIKDDAYLNLICCPMGSLSATAIHGIIETIWG
jgi:hypothetical protein